MKFVDADKNAIQSFFRAEPAWYGILSAKDAIGQKDYTLLHSGPPMTGEKTTTTLNSAAVACVFEGWAKNFSEADELIKAEKITFLPAQDYGVATPLAAVVSPSMQLISMVDQNNSNNRAYSPINGGGHGGAPAPRYGRKTPEALDLLKYLNNDLALTLAKSVKTPIPWFPIIDESLVNGDDAHLRHVYANEKLLEIMDKNLPANFRSSKEREFIKKWPIFNLNFWMAAAKCSLSSASHIDGSSFVTSMGGNGKEFGIKISGNPNTWFCEQADIPKGRTRDPFSLDDCTGAYGDSALAECFGLGAMALSFCPEMQKIHDGFFDRQIFDIPKKLYKDVHPFFHKSKARAGLLASTVVEEEITPIIELGLVERTGVHGGLGAGLYQAPFSTFKKAVTSLNQNA